MSKAEECVGCSTARAKRSGIMRFVNDVGSGTEGASNQAAVSLYVECRIFWACMLRMVCTTANGKLNVNVYSAQCDWWTRTSVVTEHVFYEVYAPHTTSIRDQASTHVLWKADAM